MKKFISLFLPFVVVSTNLFAQECDGQRYYSQIFSQVELTSDIKFGQNVQPTILDPANIQELFLDVYEPQGDTLSARPLIIWAFGGGFIFGNKESNDVVTLSNEFAKMGYVCASIDYRLSTNLIVNGGDISNAYEAVLKAMHDMRASIRYFYKDATTTDEHRIDTTRIYIGGVSAGAITALQIVHLDELSEVPSELMPYFQANGGFNGFSGNPGYSDDVAGIISLCGAVLDTAIINPTISTPIVSMHGTADSVVPYDSSPLTLLDINVDVDGSSSIHHKLEEYGIINDFYTWYGANHTPFILNSSPEDELYMDTTIQFVRDFLFNLVCEGVTSVDESNNLISTNLSVYPNPSQDIATIEFELAAVSDVNLSLMDLTGRIVMNRNKSDIPAGIYREKLEMNNLETGIYLLALNVQDRTVCSHIIKK